MGPATAARTGRGRLVPDRGDPIEAWWLPSSLVDRVEEPQPVAGQRAGPERPPRLPRPGGRRPGQRAGPGRPPVPGRRGAAGPAGDRHGRPAQPAAAGLAAVRPPGGGRPRPHPAGRHRDRGPGGDAGRRLGQGGRGRPPRAGGAAPAPPARADPGLRPPGPRHRGPQGRAGPDRRAAVQDLADPPAGRDRRRGRPLLRAQGRRRPGDRPRRRHQPAQRRGQPGRQHHHPAAGPQQLPRPQGHLDRPQDQGGGPRRPARGEAVQGRDPPPVPEPGLLRRRLLRGRGGQQGLLPQAAPPRSAWPRRPCSPGSSGSRSAPSPASTPSGPSSCATRCWSG